MVETLDYDDPDPPRMTLDQWGRAVAHSSKVTAARMHVQDEKRMNQLLETYNEAGALSETASTAIMEWAKAVVWNDRVVGFITEAIARIDEGDSADPPRIPPRTRNRHWDAAYELFESDNTDAAVAGAFIMQLLAIQEAACDIQAVRRN